MVQISISGYPGSGKSTVARLLAERLGFKPPYSIGNLRSKMALDRGLTIDDLNKLGEKEAFTDKEVDDYQRAVGKKEDNFVIEGRLSFYFIPNSYKIFLSVEKTESAKRIYEAQKGRDKRPDEPEYKSIDDVLKTISARVESDALRYKKYYGVDYTNQKQYDVVINTTHLSAEEVVESIIESMRKKKLINNLKL